MAADDYHNNKFIFKAISAFRIIVGVAVTLAVLFAMVWLIDYSSIRPSSKRNQISLLPDHREDDTPQQSRTFFEALLNKGSQQKTSVDGDKKNISDRKPIFLRDNQPPALTQPESSQVGSRSDVPPAAQPVEPSHARTSSVSQPADAVNVFAVQLGSFHQAERARMFSENLAARGYQPYILNSAMPDGTRTYRVRIGRFATREEAMNLAAKIEKAEKISVFVTSQ
jgi:cell division septation protein DedD